MKRELTKGNGTKTFLVSAGLHLAMHLSQDIDGVHRTRPSQDLASGCSRALHLRKVRGLQDLLVRGPFMLEFLSWGWELGLATCRSLSEPFAHTPHLLTLAGPRAWMRCATGSLPSWRIEIACYLDDQLSYSVVSPPEYAVSPLRPITISLRTKSPERLGSIQISGYRLR